MTSQRKTNLLVFVKEAELLQLVKIMRQLWAFVNYKHEDFNLDFDEGDYITEDGEILTVPQPVTSNKVKDPKSSGIQIKSNLNLLQLWWTSFPGMDYQTTTPKTRSNKEIMEMWISNS